MGRSLQIFLFTALLTVRIITIQAQTKINSCLYIGGKDKYVLSEKIKSDDGQTQTFNSLFIWDKDKEIRIVFLYDRKFPALNKSAINHLKSFESFLPTFKQCFWIENPKYKSHGVTTISNMEGYDETFRDGRENDVRGDDFPVKLKTLINARNKKYNPLADKFGRIYVSDGDGEVMSTMKKEKGKK